MTSPHPLIQLHPVTQEVRNSTELWLAVMRDAGGSSARNESPNAAYSMLRSLAASLSTPHCTPSFPVDHEGHSVDPERIDLHVGLDGYAPDRVIPLSISSVARTLVQCEDFAAAQAWFTNLLVRWLPQSPFRELEPELEPSPYPYQFRPTVTSDEPDGPPPPLEAKLWDKGGRGPRFYVNDWHFAIGVVTNSHDNRRPMAHLDGRAITGRQLAALAKTGAYVDEDGGVHLQRYEADDVLPVHEATERFASALAKRGLVVTTIPATPAPPKPANFEQLLRERLE